ncbi:MAG: GNAT family N-acetyltransferase [bacterium]|nr:GNAT family N-acetyltransferase [bacterium]
MTHAARIRPARRGDANELATLAGELGYPSSTGELALRLAPLLADPEQLVLVAVDEEDRAIAWVHAAVRRQLDSDRCVEVVGLVVGERRRGAGVGASLLQAAEDWARAQGVTMVVLHSNVTRTGAHAFYLRQGYEQVKVGNLFRRTVG